MNYERLTKRNGLCVAMKNCQLSCRSCDNLHCSNGIVCKTVAEVVNRLAELEDMIEDGRLVEKYFIKKEQNPMAKYPWVVGEIIADHHTFIMVKQCKTQAEAEAKLKELKGEI